jgi:hypothetical protein
MVYPFVSLYIVKLGPRPICGVGQQVNRIEEGQIRGTLIVDGADHLQRPLLNTPLLLIRKKVVPF